MSTSSSPGSARSFMPAATTWSVPSSARRSRCSARIAASTAAIFRSKNCGRTTPRSIAPSETPAPPRKRERERCPFASRELDNHLAQRRSRLHGLESLAKVFERHHLADDRGQLARCEPAEELHNQTGVNFRLASLYLRQIDPQQCAALEQGKIERQRR